MSNPGQPTISPGASGEVVRRAQRGLRRTGRGGVAVDGVYGGPMEAAVKEFQQAARLKVDGVIGPRTWEALPSGHPMPTLEEGSRGLVVARLQNILTNGAAGQWERTPGPIDEWFGPHTRAAVEAFQEWARVPVDGVVGERTWSVPLPFIGTTLEVAVGPENAAAAAPS